MKLYTLGPVEMYPRTLEIASKQVPYFRTPEFSKIVLESEERLKKFVHTQPDAKTVFLTASGSGAMEATVINCLKPTDRVLVINGGSFGHRFVDLCKLHEIPFDAVNLEFGETLTAEKLAPFEKTYFDALLVNVHETSTGQLYSMDLLADFCKRKGMLLIVDAISSFLADPVDMEKYGIDALIISSQKGLALAPGLSVVLLSGRMYEQRVKNNGVKSMYFDFNSHIENGKRGQTPFTPAVEVILELHDMLLYIEEKGLDAVLAHAAEVARDMRQRLEDVQGVSVPDFPLSNATTPIVIEKGNAGEVFRILKDEYGMMLTPCGGALADKVLRIGHLGNHSVEDNQILLETLQKVL